MVRIPRVLAAGPLLLALWPGCTCGSPTSGAPSSSATPRASAAPSAGPSAAPSASVGGPELSSRDPEVRPVYPPLDGPPLPQAQRFCSLVHELPLQRGATCCKRAPGTGFLSECLRNLSGALRGGAVQIADEGLQRCEQARAEQLSGCDWVLPLQQPPLPDACRGLLQGTRKAGAVCRSTLECEGSLHCAGVGPTSTGRCVAAIEDGPCSPAVDPLVVYTLQDAERRQPACKQGFCDRRRCHAWLKPGERCTHQEACGPGAHCDGVCRPGEAGKVGDPCLGGRCEAGARCDGGKCVATRAEGAACERDEQCRGACVVSGPRDSATAQGTCGPRCSIAMPPNLAKLPPRKPGG